MAVVEKGKQMAKAVALTGGESRPVSQVPGRIQDFRGKATEFLADVRGEMRKVVTPPQKEVQATTTVVIATVFAFAAFFYVVDFSLGHAIQYVLKTLGGVQ